MGKRKVFIFFKLNLVREMLEYNGYREGPLIELKEFIFGIQKTNPFIVS